MYKIAPMPSEFQHLPGVEYFVFEEEFMEDNLRCIPMVIRFKCDLAGIKLKLGEWGRFTTEERIALAKMGAYSVEEQQRFQSRLEEIIFEHTGQAASKITMALEPLWDNGFEVPEIVQLKAADFGVRIPYEQWGKLTVLQRFALIKLCRPGHENRNFPIALREFGLMPRNPDC